jgi:hypothetical protein
MIEAVIPVVGPTTYDGNQKAVLIAVLFAIGLMTFAAVLTLRSTPEICKPFTIGVSAIGSCDRIAGN